LVEEELFSEKEEGVVPRSAKRETFIKKSLDYRKELLG